MNKTWLIPTDLFDVADDALLYASRIDIVIKAERLVRHVCSNRSVSKGLLRVMASSESQMRVLVPNITYGYVFCLAPKDQSTDHSACQDSDTAHPSTGLMQVMRRKTFVQEGLADES